MNVRQPISHLAVDGVSLLYPDVRVLTDFSLTVDAGQVVALIGQNGSGKSTAIGVAAGELLPDRGRVVRPERVGVLHQELAPAGDGTVGALVENAVAPVRALAERVEALSQAVARAPNDESLENELALAIAEAELADAWTIEVGVAEVMAGVGLADLPRERELTALSGGQRQRLALAAVLVARPTLLLLDEPTNHLDEAGQEFLTDRLRRWRGPVLLASHDRAFLDEVADQVVDLDPAPSPAQRRRHGTVYTGAYSDYRRERAAELRRWAEQYATEQAELERLRGVAATSHSEVFHKDTVATEMRKAAKFYSDRSAKTIGRRVRNARKRLERLEVEQIGPPPAPLRFTGFEEVLGERAGALGQSESAAEPVLALSEAGLSGRVAPTSLALGPQDRLLVTGANGTGKTTLIELLAGHLVPDHGHREVVRGLRIGVLAQDVRWDATDLAGSPADAFDRRQVWPPDGVISPRDLLRPLHELSLGTQRRVALALLAADPPDVLCLDEPTNHLALGLVEELEAAIDSHPGAVVVASHDRWLRRRWTGRRLDLGQRTDVRAGA